MLTISTTYPTFEVEYYQPRADIEQRVSRVQITTRGPHLEIDQMQSRNELGIGGYQHMSGQIRARGYQKTLDAIAEIAAEGDEVVQGAGRFREEMIFAHQARRRMEEQIPELNIRVAPNTRPRISFDYEQQISWDQGGAIIKHHVQPPKITWHLGGVKVDVQG